MSVVSVTLRRTVGRARGLYMTALSIGGFLAAFAILFLFNLQSAEGGRLPLVAVWAVSVAPVLPALAAFLAMDVWSEERQTGRLELLLATAVRERDLVFGKFLGVLILMAAAVATCLVTTVVVLAYVAPGALEGVNVLSFLPGLFALFVQGTLWCAVAVAASSMTPYGAAAACGAVGVTIALPRAVWAAFKAWAPGGQPTFGEMPLDAHVVDLATGVVSSGTVITYFVLALVVLFVASKSVASARLVGRGARLSRVSTGLALTLSLAFAFLASLLAMRLDTSVDLPFCGNDASFSKRMHDTLSELNGELTISLFVSRNDSRFRTVSRFLRALRREAESQGGLRLETRYVDPRWDLGAAERLIRLGATEGSLVFEKGRRVAVLPLEDGYGEGVCASTIRRIVLPPQRRRVCWTFGHGESAFDTYDSFGMSDIARDLSREGYENLKLDLSGETPVPQDSAFLVVAGAKSDFSRVELGRIDTYLKHGGRLLVLQPAEQGGVASLLPAWGIRPVAQPLPGARTLTGSDVIVSEFSDHAISAPLKGSQVVMERPLCFAPSAATQGGGGADRLEYASVAKVGTQAVAAAVERGAGAGADLAIRPTRIVAVGDATFVMNGPLAARANANRDFFLNCVAFLAGTDAAAASGTETAVLVTGMDRSTRVRLAVVLAGVLPAVMTFLLFFLVLRRRLRR